VITFITTVHVFVCFFLILVILLQAGKGGGMGIGIGGGGSQTVFGARGSQSFLGRVTSISAGIFMLTSVYLAIHSTRGVTTDGVTAPESAETAPAGQGSPAAPGDAKPAEAAPAGQPADVKPASPAEGAPK
jgi:preprotein translocase subunit SecG